MIENLRHTFLRCSCKVLGAFALFFTFALANHLQAQQKSGFTYAGIHIDTCHVDEASKKSFIDVPKSNRLYWKLQQKRAMLKKNGGSLSTENEVNELRTASISINFGPGFADLGENEQAARDAFRFAAEIWETEVVSTVPITINANFRNLGSSNVLGSNSSPLFLNPDNIVRTAALSRSLAGFDFAPGTPDGTQTYNLNFNFYFGLDGQAPSGQIDFITVVLHEIGHSMGISGLSNGGAGVGASVGGNIVVSAWDSFIELQNGTPITDLEFLGEEQSNALVSDSLFFGGPGAVAALNNQRPKIFAPSNFQNGSSYSHWDESTFLSGTPNSLMTPRLARGEVNRDIGAITRGALQDQGWVLSANVPDFDIVTSFTLVDANTQVALLTLTDGDILDIANLGTRELAIRANTNPSGVGSVGFVLEGPVQRTKTENGFPYSLFGDSDGNLTGDTFEDGQYTLIASPFTGSNLEGQNGIPLKVGFSIVDNSSPDISISSVQLINADTDEVILNIGEATLIDIAQLPTQNLNILVTTFPEEIGSVEFDLRGPVDRLQIESQAPYALYGDDPRGDFNPGPLPEGTYDFFITPFTEAGGNGLAGQTVFLH